MRLFSRVQREHCFALGTLFTLCLLWLALLVGHFINGFYPAKRVQRDTNGGADSTSLESCK